MGGGIGGGPGPDRQVVAGNAGGHRRKEHIGCRAGPAQPVPLCACLPPGPGPQQLEPRQIGPHGVGRGAIGVADPQVHRAMAAQCGETCMHFGRKGAGHRAGGGVCRPEAGLRVTAGQFFGDGKAFAHHGALGGAHRRHGARREEPCQQLCHLVRVKPGGVGPDRQAEDIVLQPAAQ